MIIEVNKMTDLSSSRLIFLGHLECQKYKKMTHEEPMRFDENCLLEEVQITCSGVPISKRRNSTKLLWAELAWQQITDET